MNIDLLIELQKTLIEKAKPGYTPDQIQAINLISECICRQKSVEIQAMLAGQLPK